MLFTKEPTKDEQKFLQENKWHRIGLDLWRHSETTDETDTKNALLITTSLLTKEALIEEDCNDLVELAIEENSFNETLNKVLDERYCFITGPAGSGKTHTIREKARQDPKYMELTATTGIAAINLGDAKTIQSTIKYFDTKSLKNNFYDNKLQFQLRRIRERKRVVGIEEASMFDSEQLDIIVDAIEEINQDKNPRKLGLHLIGDLCQLPPVKAQFICKANSWSLFEKNTIKLEKIWRQDNSKFIEAINFVRKGDGKSAVPLLRECGVTFIDKEIPEFQGTTLIPNNADVDTFNNNRLAKLEGKLIRISPTRRGVQQKDWGKYIPYEMRFKKNAYVMILSNDIENWSYVNGDCGFIKEYNESEDAFYIELVRNKRIVKIERITRVNFYEKEPPQAWFNSMFSPYQDFKTGDWVVGKIIYHPLRLAWASTIHKSQGLSLDLVQINTRPQFFGEEAMAYVSISRARTPEGLFLIGSEENFAQKVKLSKEVLAWI